MCRGDCDKNTGRDSLKKQKEKVAKQYLLRHRDYEEKSVNKIFYDNDRRKA